MNKKTLIVVAATAVLSVSTCFARPGGPSRPGGGHRPHGGGRPPAVRHHGGHHHRHHGGSFWGRGGRNFVPGFMGGVVGGIIANEVVRPAPVVVSTPTVITTTPVYSTQRVWVEGCYVDQIQPNGTVVRVWQPGHYEYQQTIVN